jgi:hypothetical protein
LRAVKPLQRARDGAGRAWEKSSRGTARTAAWVKKGVGDAFGKASDRARGLVSRGGDAPEARPSADDGPGPAERLGLTRLAGRAREDRRVAIAEICVGILIVLWVGWTIHVWSENGSTAGLGVLITWPAVLLALAIVVSPFVGAGMLLKRHRLAAAGAPGIDGKEEVAPGAKPEAEKKPDDGADAAEDPAGAGEESEDEKGSAGEGPGDDEEADAGEGEAA